jgi:hypothetical protein
MFWDKWCMRLQATVNTYSSYGRVCAARGTHVRGDGHVARNEQSVISVDSQVLYDDFLQISIRQSITRARVLSMEDVFVAAGGLFV